MFESNRSLARQSQTFLQFFQFLLFFCIEPLEVGRACFGRLRSLQTGVTFVLESFKGLWGINEMRWSEFAGMSRID